MKYENGILKVNAGSLLYRMLDGLVFYEDHELVELRYINGIKLPVPYKEKPTDFLEYTLEEFERKQEGDRLLKQKELGEEVNSLIREKYSESEEFAILRLRDIKPEEFKEYNDYCEECKSKVKQLYSKF